MPPALIGQWGIFYQLNGLPSVCFHCLKTNVVEQSIILFAITPIRNNKPSTVQKYALMILFALLNVWKTECSEIIIQIVMQYNKTDSDSQLLKLLIIGNSGVGKSCMLMRYVDNNFTTAFYNTIGVDFKMKTVDVDGKRLRLQIWDTAGQDRFRTITSTYYKGAHGILVVYDVTDRESFEGLRFWLQEIDKYASENVERLVVGNKSDEMDKRKVSFEEGLEFASSHKLEFTEVSALNAQNIAKAFEMMARKVLKRISSTPQTAPKLPATRTELKKKNSSGGMCC